MFYKLNMEIYSGKRPDKVPYNLDNLFLMFKDGGPIFNPGFNVVTGNGYPGTLRKNKTVFPTIWFCFHMSQS